MRWLCALSLAAFCLTFSAFAFDDTDGKTTFKSNCVVCHGPDGAGSKMGKSLNVPDLRTPEIQKKTDTELSGAVTDGKGNMPGFKSRLTPEQVQAVIAYVRELGKAKAASTK